VFMGFLGMRAMEFGGGKSWGSLGSFVGRSGKKMVQGCVSGERSS